MKKETIIKYEEGRALYEQGLSLTKIATQLTIHRGRFTKYLKENGVQIINKQNLPRMNSKAFEIIDTEEKAYWLGFLYADGYVGDNTNHIDIKLGIIDYDHLTKFKKFLNYEGDVVVGIASGKAYCRISFRSKQINEDLKKLGCISNKSLVLSFPNKQQVPIHLQKHFVRGYVDGDGSLFISNGKLRFSFLGTKEFIQGAVRSMNWKRNKIRKPSGAYTTEYGGWHVLEILKPLYDDCNIYLDRKYKKYLEMKHAVLSRNI